MKYQRLIKKIQKQGFKLVSSEFSEDGYVIKLKAIRVKNDNISTASELIRKNIKKVELIKYEGLVVTECSITNGMCVMLFVPTSIEEMSEFIWTYVEKYGDDKSIINALVEAFSALEKAIERMPENYKTEKIEAVHNYKIFSSVIF